MAYSLEKRKKALELFDSGETITESARQVNVTMQTVRNWIVNRDNPIVKRTIKSKKIPDLNELKIFVEKNHGKSIKQMAAIWGNGSLCTFYRHLMMIGYPRKYKKLNRKKIDPL